MHVEIHDSHLSDTRARQAGELISACVHCGFCLETCPTYLDNRDERDKSEARDERQMNRRLSEDYSDDDDAMQMQPDCWTPTPSNVFGSGNRDPPRRGGRGGGGRGSVSFSNQL